MKFCLQQVLRVATPDEKRLILGYKSSTADAIFKAYQEGNITSFEDFESYLTPHQSQEIIQNSSA